MKRLWSPWRIKYIQREVKDESCIFCNALQKPDGVENLIVFRGEHAFVILNRYPYTSGHVMVVPYAHQPSFEDLDADTRCELMEMITHATRVVRAVYKPEGFNVGANLGAIAGAGVSGHVHFHIVPRWGGDANFMTTIGEARVLPEELDETYRRLKEEWNK
ncbi:MAG TPA: HIT domain-containing protein [Longilinea sp.]|nr:HIT domain-containing protein [Longilinea sp.]